MTKNIVDKIYAAISFGVPDSQTLVDLMDELKTVVADAVLSAERIARIERQAYERGQAFNSETLSTVRQLVIDHYPDDCATEEYETLEKIAHALGYKHVGTEEEL